MLHKTFGKRDPRFWTLGVSLWALLSGGKGAVQVFAEISVHGDWGLQAGEYEHSSGICPLHIVVAAP